MQFDCAAIAARSANHDCMALSWFNIRCGASRRARASRAAFNAVRRAPHGRGSRYTVPPRPAWQPPR